MLLNSNKFNINIHKDTQQPHAIMANLTNDLFEEFPQASPSLFEGLDATHDEHRDKRSVEELTKLVKSEQFDPAQLSNEEIIDLMLSRQVSVYRLESILGKANAKRCVEIRRQYYIRELELLEKIDQLQKGKSGDISSTQTQSKIDVLKRPQEKEFDYSRVVGACCENVIGCIRLPVGLVGPLLLDDQNIFVPMATTEGCLVASTSRGLSALTKSGGVVSRVRKDCMTRAPIIRFVDPDLKDALKNVDRAIEWLQDPINKEKIKAAFRSTSRHTSLMDYTIHPIGREIHIRFEAHTGDAMGMNMCSKGAEMAIKEMQRNFPTMVMLTVSGNMCTDKKPSAVNLILGRGKSVECNATLTEEVVEKVLKVSIDKLYEVWLKKNMIGSAMAGSVGGFNSHAANIVAAIFIATGQDAAQVVSSSNCILTLEKGPRGSLEVNCKMPSIECGTVGGGTVLDDQSDYLKLMGINGSTSSSAQSLGKPGEMFDRDSNACKLARIICSTVMAAELSLLASLTEGTLVKSHMTHNRSAQPCNVV
jgi:hydroxymethylglutaryl-CoA reductase (NADPH)